MSWTLRFFSSIYRHLVPPKLPYEHSTWYAEQYLEWGLLFFFQFLKPKSDTISRLITWNCTMLAQVTVDIRYQTMQWSSDDNKGINNKSNRKQQRVHYVTPVTPHCPFIHPLLHKYLITLFFGHIIECTHISMAATGFHFTCPQPACGPSGGDTELFPKMCYCGTFTKKVINSILIGLGEKAVVGALSAVNVYSTVLVCSVLVETKNTQWQTCPRVCRVIRWSHQCKE